MQRSLKILFIASLAFMLYRVHIAFMCSWPAPPTCWTVTHWYGIEFLVAATVAACIGFLYLGFGE